MKYVLSLFMILFYISPLLAKGAQLNNDLNFEFVIVPKNPNDPLPKYNDLISEIKIKIINTSKNTQVFRYLDYYAVPELYDINNVEIKAHDLRAIMGYSFAPVKKENYTLLKPQDSFSISSAFIRQTKGDKNFKLNYGTFQTWENLKAGTYYLKINISSLLGEKAIADSFQVETATKLTLVENLESVKFKFQIK